MSKIKISSVSYLNSIPFIYGIEQSAFLQKEAVLHKDIPAVCAKKLITNQADIALIPIGAIPDLTNYQIISDYCIGADQKVDTVLLVSEVPLQEITQIFLDYHSRTSIKLVQILAKFFWKINPQWVVATEGYEKKIKNNTAGVIIGDRAFSSDLKKNKYIIDLAAEWYKFTRKPFVFASWIALKAIPDNFFVQFNNALKYGIDNIPHIITELKKQKKYQNIDFYDYFNHKISYKLTPQKNEAMALFLNYMSLLK